MSIPVIFIIIPLGEKWALTKIYCGLANTQKQEGTSRNITISFRFWFISWCRIQNWMFEQWPTSLILIIVKKYSCPHIKIITCQGSDLYYAPGPGPHQGPWPLTGGWTVCWAPDQVWWLASSDDWISTLNTEHFTQSCHFCFQVSVSSKIICEIGIRAV